MNDEQLKRAIQSIGKGCFVKYYEEFRNLARPNEDLVELLMNREGYTETASSTRVSQSKRIVQAGRDADILVEISQSTRLDFAIIEKAKKLLQKYYPNYLKR
jgi:hypothetical protein